MKADPVNVGSEATWEGKSVSSDRSKLRTRRGTTGPCGLPLSATHPNGSPFAPWYQRYSGYVGGACVTHRGDPPAAGRGSTDGPQ